VGVEIDDRHREAMLVESRGLRRFAATPGHGDKHPDPEGVVVGTGMTSR
jgi:hypothetical protein